MRGRTTGINMQGRRRRDEPFNPFAPNASQKAKERREKSQKNKPKPSQQVRPPQQDLEAKRRAALQELNARREAEAAKLASIEKPTPKATTVSEEPKPVQKVPKEPQQPKSETRAERIAKLKEASEATAQFAKDAKSAKEDLVVETEIQSSQIVVESDLEAQSEAIEATPEISQQPKKAGEQKQSSNVFKTIKTEIKPKDKRGKKRRSADKKGGGRQPQSKKLDRRKMLEYKYAAKDLLDNEMIKEEHRSNILGQIWAKGERISAEAAVEFINQKENELIIPSDVASELKTLVKRYTTRR